MRISPSDEMLNFTDNECCEILDCRYGCVLGKSAL